ncbi:MAG: PP0621 family protein [Casimicrobium sp.]
MGKIIFWIVVFFLVLLGLRLVSVHQTRRDARERRDAEAEKNKRDTTPANESMVRCTLCQAYIPKSSALMSPTGARCSDANCGHKR